MVLVALTAAAVIVLGAPAFAAAFWLRAYDPKADSIELVAVGYGGIAVSALALWLGAGAFSPSWQVVLLASLTGAAALGVPAFLRLRRRAGRPDGPQADVLTGQYDGREVPAATTARAKRDATAAFPRRNPHFVALGVAAVVFAALVYVPFLAYGLHRADGVHRMAMTDWYKHLMTATALTSADAFPPPNPFLHPAEAAPYYYGFHLVASSMARLTGTITNPLSADDPAYLSLLLLTLMTALATPFVAYVAARTIVGTRSGGAGEAPVVPLLASLGATFLAGFDLIPVSLDGLTNAIAGGGLGNGLAGLRAVIPSTHLDYWIHHNERQFNAPYLTTAWAPQHMAGVLVALLIVHLVLRRGSPGERRGPHVEGSVGPVTAGGSWLLPGVLLAGLCALSAYVAVGLAVGVVGAGVIESLRSRMSPWRTSSRALWWAPGVAAAFLALPVMTVLGSGTGSGMVLHVSDAGRWVNGAVFSSLFGPRPFTSTIDSVAVYVVEFGILGVLAFLEVRRMRRRKRSNERRTHVIGLVISIVVFVTFVRPPVGGPNNLYARPLVLVWFLLAPFAAVYFARSMGFPTLSGAVPGSDRPVPATSRSPGSRRRGSRWVVGAVVLCLAATGYALAGVVLEGVMFWAAPAGIVEAARWANRHLPAGSVVAVHPDDFHSSFGYWLRRPLLLADERHALLFGGTEQGYERAADALRSSYSSSRAEVAAVGFDALDVTHVMVGPALSAPVFWLDSRCFEVLYRGDGWVVAGRTPATCSSPPE
jgi:hypothetical protein